MDSINELKHILGQSPCELFFFRKYPHRHNSNVLYESPSFSALMRPPSLATTLALLYCVDHRNNFIKTLWNLWWAIKIMEGSHVLVDWNRNIPIGSCTWILGLQLVELYGEVCETFRRGSLAGGDKPLRFRWVFRIYCLTFLPFLFPWSWCGWNAISKLPAPVLTAMTSLPFLDCIPLEFFPKIIFFFFWLFLVMLFVTATESQLKQCHDNLLSEDLDSFPSQMSFSEDIDYCLKWIHIN